MMTNLRPRCPVPDRVHQESIKNVEEEELPPEGYLGQTGHD